MILYSIVAWPYIQEENYKRTNIAKIGNETDRAMAIIATVDIIVNFAS